MTLDHSKTVIQSSIQDRPAQITIAGDIDAKASIAAVGATVGKLSGLTPPASAAGGDTAVFRSRHLDQTLYRKGRSERHHPGADKGPGEDIARKNRRNIR